MEMGLPVDTHLSYTLSRAAAHMNPALFGVESLQQTSFSREASKRLLPEKSLGAALEQSF